MMVIRLSDLCTGHLYLHKIPLVLICVRGWVDPRATARRNQLMQNTNKPNTNQTHDLPACSTVPPSTVPPHTPVCVLQASVLRPSHSNTLHILTPFLNVKLRQNICMCYASQCNVSHCKTIPCVLRVGCADSIINQWLWPTKSPNLNFICGTN